MKMSKSFKLIVILLLSLFLLIISIFYIRYLIFINDLKELKIIFSNNNYKKKLNKKVALYDLKILKKTIFYLYPEPFKRISKKKFKKNYNKIKNEIKKFNFTKNSQNDIKTFLYLEYSKFISLFKEGHFIIENQFNNIRNLKTIPFLLYYNKKTFYLLCLDNDKIYKYYELIKIENVKPEQYFKKYLNYVQTNSYLKLFNNFIFYILFDYFNKNKNYIDITYKDINGLIFDKKFKLITLKDLFESLESFNNWLNFSINTYLSNRGEFKDYKKLKFYNVDFEYNLDKNLCYLKVKEFKFYNFNNYFYKIFNIIYKNNIKNIIIDLRNNPGGIDNIELKLFSFLYPNNFKYFKDKFDNIIQYNIVVSNRKNFLSLYNYKYYIKNKFYCNNFIKKTNNTNLSININMNLKKQFYKKNIFVLQNRNCFSSTLIFLSLLKEYKVGRTIGEAIPDIYDNMYGNLYINSAKLPYTNFFLNIPSSSYYFLNKDFAIPDIEVHQTIDDLLKGKDTILEYTLNLIEKERE